ncbi:hypothetical protein K491DRAFT_758222 [Lophiostoma macrostomum CBS 122681]|uniref:Uncharacterized protein n=1 Tax=Lophiostoma macrostomum CBS 122681 TaxID=1314788 RepID=A0A6A6T7W1_9PLEO|nr:hypothetical protein K491DRAFT_758222 [Lophiostoma macrostomum CBS 122681]
MYNSVCSPVSATMSDVNFAGLCDDLHYMILMNVLETAPSTLCALARASRALNAIANPYIYRNVVIDEGKPNTAKQRQADQLIYRLRERGKRNVGRFVRELRIERLDSQLALEEILDSIQDLRIFRWNANTRLSPMAINKLHVRWPDLKICIRNHKRNEATMFDRALDPALLSSKQLDALDFIIYGDVTGITPFYSEWPHITRLLQKGGNCRSLRLHIQSDAYYKVPKIFEDPNNIGKGQLHLRTGSIFPPLEELSILPGSHKNRYTFDPSHCAVLRECIDWSRIRKLDFRDDCPVSFFTEMCGRVTNLESLRLHLPTLTPQSEVSRAVVMFVDSVLGLKSLDLVGMESWIEVLWPVIDKHKTTLETLICRPHRHSYDPSSYLDPKYLTKFANGFPRLQYLGINGKLKDEQMNAQLDEEYLFPLYRSSLQTLDLTLLLPNGPSVFTQYRLEDRNQSWTPDLSIIRSKKVAIALGERIYRAQRGALKNLTMHFLKRDFEISFQGMQMMEARMRLKRSERDDVEMMDEMDRWEVKGALRWNPLAESGVVSD